MTKTKKVVIIKGKDHYKTTQQALELISEQLPKIGKTILIAPNLLTEKKMEPVVTNPRVCMAIADFIIEKYGLNEEITLGAGTTAGNSIESIKNNEYLNYSETKFLFKHPWVVKDLNIDKSEKWFPIFSPGLDYEVEIGIAETAIHSDYLVSAAKMKTHDVLGLTLTLKNLMSSVCEVRRVDTKEIINKGKSTKSYMHGFGAKKPASLTKEINTSVSKVALAINLIRLAKIVFQNRNYLAVLDAITAMEGDGPLSHGIPKNANLIIAGTDVVAVDTVASEIADVRPKIQYILQAGKAGIGETHLDNIEIIGESIKNVKTEFKMHKLFKFSNFTRQELKILDEKTI